MAAATSWAGGFGGALTGGGLTTTSVGTVAMQAETVAVASRAAVSTINNGFDLGKVGKELTSKEAMRGYATSMALSGVTFGVSQATGLGNVASEMNNPYIKKRRHSTFKYKTPNQFELDFIQANSISV